MIQNSSTEEQHNSQGRQFPMKQLVFLNFLFPKCDVISGHMCHLVSRLKKLKKSEKKTNS